MLLNNAGILVDGSFENAAIEAYTWTARLLQQQHAADGGAKLRRGILRIKAQLDRVGCFQYEDVAGARSNALPDHVPAEVKQDRWDRFMEKAQAISEAKLAAKVGKRIDVIVDEIDADAATCRTKADAPEIDGNLFIDEDFQNLKVGDIVTVEVEEAGEYDLWGRQIT